MKLSGKGIIALFTVALVIGMLSIPVASEESTPNTNQTQEWVRQGMVLDYGGFGSGTEYPFVLYDGSYKMWYSGLSGSSGNIYYATSSDGYNWLEQGLAHSTGRTYTVAPSVLKEDDGTYKMWYCCKTGSYVDIYLAESNDGLSWTEYGLVVPHGSPGSPDSEYASQPFVYKDAGLYKMYYQSYAAGAVSYINYAISPDGYTWTKHGVVKERVNGQTKLQSPSVIKRDDGTFEMWYQANYPGTIVIDHAYSLDGINWIETGTDLDVGPPGALDDFHVVTPFVMKNEVTGEDWMYYSGRDGLRSRVFLAIKEVEVPNQPPVADAGPDRNVTVGEDVFFDGSGSYDPDGTIVSYDWDFGDGGTGSGISPVHSYSDDGQYNVMLMVTDNGGATATDTCIITVIAENKPPVADAGPDQTVMVDETVMFDGSGSYDPDGYIVSYEWDFGDGNTGTGINLEHSYQNEGIYTVTLTITDDRGATDVDSCNINVTEPDTPPPEDPPEEPPTSASLDITKTKVAGPDEVETHTAYGWILEIVVINIGGSNATDVVVYDVIPAEFEIGDYSLTHGIASYVQNGNGQMGSTALTWEIGLLEGGEIAELDFVIFTRLNPAGKQEFTSPGTYSLNDGAWVIGIDSVSGEELNAGPTPVISVVAVDPESDGGEDDLDDDDDEGGFNETDDDDGMEDIIVSLGNPLSDEPEPPSLGLSEFSTKQSRNGILPWLAMVLIVSAIMVILYLGRNEETNSMALEELEKKLIKGEISEEEYLTAMKKG